MTIVNDAKEQIVQALNESAAADVVHLLRMLKGAEAEVTRLKDAIKQRETFLKEEVEAYTKLVK